MIEEDIDLLTEDIDVLKDEIYSDERTIDIVENTIEYLKSEYDLLSQKKSIKKKATFNFLKKFMFKLSVISLIVTISSIISTFNFVLLGIIAAIILVVIEVKGWMKDTEEIRMLEKTTTLEKLLEGIHNQEKSLRELNIELKHNEQQLQELYEQIKIIKNRNSVIEKNSSLLQISDNKPLQLSRLKKIS